VTDLAKRIGSWALRTYVVGLYNEYLKQRVFSCEFAPDEDVARDNMSMRENDIQNIVSIPVEWHSFCRLRY